MEIINQAQAQKFYKRLHSKSILMGTECDRLMLEGVLGQEFFAVREEFELEDGGRVIAVEDCGKGELQFSYIKINKVTYNDIESFNFIMYVYWKEELEDEHGVEARIIAKEFDHEAAIYGYNPWD